jgi:hypothetical protein
MTPRWQEADEAVESLVATLVEAAARTVDRGFRKRPRGRSRSQRRPQSTRRRIAEVVRAHKLAPGVRVDRNVVAALLIGHRDLVSNPVLVVAVAQACGIIAGRKLSPKKAARMRAASLRVAKLIARAEADTLLLPKQRTAAPLAEPAPSAASVPLAEFGPAGSALVAAAPDAGSGVVEPVPAAEAEPALGEAMPTAEPALVESAPVESASAESAPVESAPIESAVVEAVPPAGSAPVWTDRRRRRHEERRRQDARRRRNARRRRARRWLLAVAAMVVVIVALLVFG